MSQTIKTDPAEKDITIVPVAGQKLTINPVDSVKLKSARVSDSKLTGIVEVAGTFTAPTPDPEPEPEPEPEPTPTPDPTGAFILMPKADFMARPMSGASWDNVVRYAAMTASKPDLTDQDDKSDTICLAKAIVATRKGDASLRSQVIDMLKGAMTTAGPGSSGGDTLGMVRQMYPLVLAADLIGYRDEAFVQWVRAMQTWKNPDRGYSIRSTHELRPNNWGTHAFASRIACDYYLNDQLDLAQAIKVAKGYFGDRSSYAGFSYGNLEWQADPSKPVGVNPKGAVKSSTNVDGILPDDMRRSQEDSPAVFFPKVGEKGPSYTWEALQGVVVGAEILWRHGVDAFAWSDRAIERAIDRIYTLGYPATGDDQWQPWIFNRHVSTTRPATRGTSPGKGFGFADFLWG